MTARNVVVFDIDHTLSDAAWRDNMLGGDWDAYHEASRDDKPVDAMLVLAQELKSYYYVVCVTTRPEKWRKMTIEWLLKYGVPVSYLNMRPDDDYRAAAVIKAEQVTPFLEKIAFAIDDNDAVCAAYRALGGDYAELDRRFSASPEKGLAP